MGPTEPRDVESRPCHQDLQRDFDEAFEISCDKRYFLQNRTPRWVRIVDVQHRYGEILLSPLGARVMSGKRLAPFAEDLRLPRQRHQLRIREYCDHGMGLVGSGDGSGPVRWRDRVARWPGRLVLPVLLVCLGLGIHAVVTDGTLKRPLFWLAAAVAVGVGVATLGVASSREVARRRIEVSSDLEEGDIDFGVGGTFYDGNDTLRRTKHLLALGAVVVVAVVLPAIAIFVATDAKDFIVLEGGLAVVEGRESRLIGRLIQVTYTAVLSLFPALLYFQFDLHRVGTIRGEWVRAIFRMDREMETLADVNARYGDDLSEASSYSTDSARFLGGRNSPIVIATLLVALGWTLLVLPTASYDFSGSTRVAALARTAQGAADRAGDADDLSQAGSARAVADDAGAEAERVVEESVGATAPSTTTEADAGSTDSMEREAAAAAAAAERARAAEARIDQPFFQLLDPTPSAAAMAFLGAYFFGVYLLLRGYFRGDLRPKMYSQISARLITVVVLAYLINALFFDQVDTPNQVVWVLSFLAGVVPTTVLQQIGRLLAPIPRALSPSGSGIEKAFERTFAAPRALTQIDGIDIHDSTQLETEGITDVPSLAKGDLVSMMVKTRLPVERLIDWADQALLIVHLDGPGDDLDERVTALRQVGVRTASAVVAAADDTATDPDAGPVIAGALSADPDGARAPGTATAVLPRLTLPMLAAQIRREPSMVPIQSWRDSQHPDAESRSTLTFPPEAAGEVDLRDAGPDAATELAAVD